MKLNILVILVFCTTQLYSGEIIMGEITPLSIGIVLLILMGIGVLIRYISSKHMNTIEKMYQEMLEKQQKIEQSQNLFLTSISENIHEIVEKTYRERVKGDAKLQENSLDIKEKKLLDVTNDLIEFLRLKSKKVEILHEKFNLNNVLNEVSGAVCSKFKGSSVELIFNIDNTIPRYLIGDSLHLEKTLHNLLEYVLGEVNDGEVSLEIIMFEKHSEKVELQFKLTDMGQGLDSKKLETLFIPVYNEESGEYKGLGLFVANELISLMNGELVVHSIEGKGTTFIVTLPFEMMDPENRRNYRLPKKILVGKKVFIVDRNYNSALAIKKAFSYFQHDVKVLSKEIFLKHMPNLSTYDIVVLDETLFNTRTIEYLQKLKQKQAIRIVALNSLLEKDENTIVDDVIDRVLFKPINQERIFELIMNLYTLDGMQFEKKKGKEENLLTHKSNIVETPNISQESFKNFKGNRLLIVEDDIINQKVLLNILKTSGMEILIANNGREAVNMIKEDTQGFNMVLMDINMPIMDGFVATQMIRLDMKFDTLPIVAFTALALESEREKIFNCGMNAYLTKPLNIGKLYSVFKMYMRISEEVFVSSAKVKRERMIPVDVLDVRKGIGYANNNEGFYMEILHEFLDAYSNSATYFNALVEAKRYEQIKTFCLDMKGLSGTIGAGKMSDLISDIYQKVLYRQNEVLVEYTEVYQQCLEELTSEINRFLAQ